MQERLITYKEVTEISGLARSTIYEKVQGGKFPAPVKLGDGPKGLSGLTDQKSFYVDISRARQEVTFLTDNVDRLRETLKQQTGEERSALDLFRERQQSIRPSRAIERSLKQSLEKPIKRSIGLSL